MNVDIFELHVLYTTHSVSQIGLIFYFGFEQR